MKRWLLRLEGKRDEGAPAGTPAIDGAPEAAAAPQPVGTPVDEGELTETLEGELLGILESAGELRMARDVELRDAVSLTESLEEHPEVRARMLIAHHGRYQTWGLAEALMGRARESIIRDAQPTRAVHFARLACWVADSIDPDLYTAPLVHDLRTQTRAALGNALRCAGHFQAAERALQDAEELLVAGTGDPLEEASVLSIRASLLTDLGSYEAAVVLQDEMCQIYRSVDDTYHLGRAMVQQTVTYGFLDPKAGVRVGQKALGYLDVEEDPHLYLCGFHAWLYCMVNAGEVDRAHMLLEANRSLYRRVGGDWVLHKQGWLEARIALFKGRYGEAEAALSILVAEFLERDLRLSGVLAALDLATCYLAWGKPKEAAQLAATMVDHLTTWGIHRRVLDAWQILHQALARETASETLVREVGRYVQRAWKNPHRPSFGEDA